MCIQGFVICGCMTGPGCRLFRQYSEEIKRPNHFLIYRPNSRLLQLSTWNSLPDLCISSHMLLFKASVLIPLLPQTPQSSQPKSLEFHIQLHRCISAGWPTSSCYIYHPAQMLPTAVLFQIVSRDDWHLMTVGGVQPVS